MPLFRCSCILGGRCNQIKADEDIPEISSNKLNSGIVGKSEGSNVVNENEMEQALLYLHRPCIGSLSLGMMVHRPGILIHRDLILTSHGNLPNFDAAVDAEFVLCYLPSARHRRSIPPKTILTRRLEPHRCFLTSEAIDLTLVACEAVPENIAEIIPLSIHQHLGSMDLLEAGHQVYVLGHLQSNEMRGILTAGSGRTTIFSWKDTSNNTLVAFTREPKDMSGLWMPGSAGFDEQGEFSFMVAKPQLSYASNSTSANTVQELSFKRKSLENTTSSDIAQYGVPLYVIQDWMLMHGIRDLDNLPPIQLSDPMSNNVTPTTASRSINESPLIPHGSLPLSDRNSISYVVMNAGRLVFESQPRQNSSSLESFISYEPSCVGNETPLQRTSTAGLELNSIAIFTKEEDSLILKEKSFELPIRAGTDEGNNNVIGENLYEPLPVRAVCLQDVVSTFDLRRSISEKVPSRPLKWHSRTSLPPCLKANNYDPGDDEWLKHDEKAMPFPKFGLDHDKLNIDELQARLSSNCVNHAPLPHEQHSDLDSSAQVESNLDDKPTLTSDASEQIYEEISLETPTVVEFTTDVDQTKQLNAVSANSSSDSCRWVGKGECSTSYVEADQKEASVPKEIDSQGKHTSQGKNTIEREIESDYIMDSVGRVGDVLNTMNSKKQYVPINNADFKMINEEMRVNHITKGEKSEPNDGSIIISEKSDAYIACNSAMNVGAIPNESMSEDVGEILGISMSVRGFNVGAFPNDSMPVKAFNVGAIPNDSMSGRTSNDSSEGKKKQPCSSASSTHISSPLRPEEVSKRIQGYGNVSTIMQSANMRNTSSKEEKGGGRRRSSSSSSGPPLKSLFLDVGSSLVSGRWMKSGSTNKAPHFDDNPS